LVNIVAQAYLPEKAEKDVERVQGPML
jgi:hypothetical protein